MTNKKQLLTDINPIRFSLSESGESGKVIARGEFARADKPTANRRIYPRAIWESNISKLKKDMADRKVLGEAEHPDSGKTSLKRVSHLITNLEVNEDGIIVGEAEILDTEDGKNLKALISGGVSLGVSSRGFGSVVQKEGFDVVQDDFNLMTFDFVADPAMGSAYPEFTSESKQHVGDVKAKDVVSNHLINEESVVVVKDNKTKKQVKESAMDVVKVEKEEPKEELPPVDADTPVELSAEEAVAKAKEILLAAHDREPKDSEMKKKLKDMVDELSDEDEDGEEDKEEKDDKPEEVKESIYPRDLAKDSSIKKVWMIDTKVMKSNVQVLGAYVQYGSGVFSASVTIMIDNNGSIIGDGKFKTEEEAQKFLKDYEAAWIKGMSAKSEGDDSEKTTNVESVCRQLALTLFMERTLSNHPDKSSIINAVDVNKYEDITQLEVALKPYIKGVKLIESTQASELNKLQEEKQILEKERITLQETVTNLKSDLKKAEDIAMKAALTAYLESRISQLPQASEIRSTAQKMKLTSKEQIDVLVESNMNQRSSKIFNDVRNGLKADRKLPDNLVEEALAAARPKKGTAILEESSLGIDQTNFNRLAGIDA